MGGEPGVRSRTKPDALRTLRAVTAALKVWLAHALWTRARATEAAEHRRSPHSASGASNDARLTCVILILGCHLRATVVTNSRSAGAMLQPSRISIRRTPTYWLGENTRTSRSWAHGNCICVSILTASSSGDCLKSSGRASHGSGDISAQSRRQARECKRSARAGWKRQSASCAQVATQLSRLEDNGALGARRCTLWIRERRDSQPLPHAIPPAEFVLNTTTCARRWCQDDALRATPGAARPTVPAYVRCIDEPPQLADAAHDALRAGHGRQRSLVRMASALQLHRDAIVITDHDQAEELAMRDYYEFFYAAKPGAPTS